MNSDGLIYCENDVDEDRQINVKRSNLDFCWEFYKLTKEDCVLASGRNIWRSCIDVGKNLI